jgi:hypothetical protein
MYKKKIQETARHQWLLPVKPATWESDIRRINV